MIKRFETWTIKRRALIVLPTGVDTSELRGRQIYAQVEDSRHAECRKLSRRLFGVILILAAINLYLCGLIWFALPAID